MKSAKQKLTELKGRHPVWPSVFFAAVSTLLLLHTMQGMAPAHEVQACLERPEALECPPVPTCAEAEEQPHVSTGVLQVVQGEVVCLCPR